MAAPNVLSTDTLFKAQHSGAIYFVVRYVKAKLLLYNIKLPLGRENKGRNRNYMDENENDRTTVI